MKTHNIQHLQSTGIVYTKSLTYNRYTPSPPPPPDTSVRNLQENKNTVALFPPPHLNPLEVAQTNAPAANVTATKIASPLL